MVLTLSGCSAEDLKVESAQVPQIILGQLSEPKTFNAALSQESPNIFGYVYEGLLTSNGQSELEPGIAEDLPEISADKKTITFTLREGLKWSDGEPLTSDDVVFTFQDVYFNPAIPNPTKDVLRVGEQGDLPTVQKIDDRRVAFILSEPFSPVVRSIGGSEILPAHILRESVETLDESGNPLFLSTWATDTSPQNLVVNGPYTLTSYTPSQRLIFEKNPYYWRKDEAGNSQPYIEKIIWQFVENQDTQFLQFRSGGLTSISVAPQYFSLLKREEERADFTIFEDGPATGTTFITFNLNKGRNENGTPLVDPIKSAWFNDLNFRKAIAYGIDRETMINNIYRGLGSLQHSPISVPSPYYLSPEEGLPTYEYNLEKAKELLLASGFKYDSLGQLEDAQGNRVRFELVTNSGNQVREGIGVQIQQDLKKIGIEVNFTPITFNSLVAKIQDSLDWECHLIGFTGGIEPHGGSTIWALDGRLHSFNQDRQDPPIEGREIADWEREIAQLYVRGAQEFDEAKRKEIYGQTQILAQENLPFIYLVNPYSMAAVRNNLENVEFSALGGAFWNLEELKISEEPEA
ncbi:MAG: ABC transporter substrate-binding protein [Cyanobacteriota bacterium]|nr:ABC transporter substrate-binding protein [Cyanobacteriota bacterium]